MPGSKCGGAALESDFRGLGFKVLGCYGFRVWGVVFRALVFTLLGLRVQRSGCRVQGLRCRL